MRTSRIGRAGSLAPLSFGAGRSELVRLTRSAARIWRTNFFAMGSWFCLGFAVHTLGLQLSAQLGARHGTLAMLSFVLGVLATLVALVLMIHSVEPSLRTARQIDASEAERRTFPIPNLVFVREPRLDVVASAVGPFLAVYAVWGFVTDQIRELFQSNYATQGLGGIDNFSISFSPDRLRFYLVLAGSAWVLRQLVALMTARRRVLPVALAGVVLEALWVFSLFALLLIGARSIRPWLRTRAVYVGVQDTWRAWLDWLPDWTWAFGLTLPQALDRALDLLVHTILPGVWQAVALPLVWLALTATVLGWREFRGRDVIAGTRLGARLSGRAAPPSSPLRTLLALATADLRTKYLPVLAALRLIGRAGPGFVGVYLLLATVLTAVQQLFDIAVTLLLGPRDVATSLLMEPVELLVSGLVFTTLSIALYAAAFDEALAVASVRGGTEVSGGTPPPGDRPVGRRPAPTAATAPDPRIAPG